MSAKKSVDGPRLDDPYRGFDSAIINFFFDLLITCIRLPMTLVLLVSDKVMLWLFGKFYIYNVSWEDPRIETTHYKLGARDKILTIASAGDNVLHYLLSGAHVVAVDLNECQLALSELKVAAAAVLSFAEFFAVFGECEGDNLRAHYPRIRPRLSESARAYWDEKQKTIGNFMYSGSSGMLAWILFRILFPLLGLGWLLRAVRDQLPPVEFRKLADSHMRQLRMLVWIADIFAPIGAALAGVPRRQLELAGSRGNTFAIVAYKIFYLTDFCRDNYFFSGYMMGRYRKNSCPDYLLERNFSKLKAAVLAGRVEFLHCSVAEACERHLADADAKPFTFFSALDHLDWLPHAYINEEMAMLKRCMTRDGHVFVRSFADNVFSPVLAWLEPERVPGTAGGREHVLLNDRVPMYFSQWSIAWDSDGASRFAPLDRCASWQAALAAPSLVGHARAPHEAHAFAQSRWQKLKVGAQIVLFPLVQRLRFWRSNESHGAVMEAFYEQQAAQYDGFREQFLWARAPLAACLPLQPRKRADGTPRVWIDVGGGTGRNLEFFPPHVLREAFDRIIVIDISQSLLDVAKARVEKIGLGDLIECVCADIHDPALFAGENAVAADIVTFSYSLSMISARRKAVATARSWLKRDGVLGVADFFYDSNDARPSPLRRVEAALQAAWFRQDHVHFLRRDDVAAVCGGDQQTPFYVEKFRGSVPFIPFLRPFHGVLLSSLADANKI